MNKLLLTPQKRKIKTLDMETPLLVPSFSSRGFPWIQNIFDTTQYDLPNICLLSAYDLSYRLLDVVPSDATDTVLIDSGCYEIGTSVGVDIYEGSTFTKPWDRQRYRDFIVSLRPDVNLILVNYDHYGSIEEQTEQAKEDFSLVPFAASDFLLKPLSYQSPFVIINEVLSNLELFAEFSILGITEKELGGSLLERCKNLVKIRSALQAIDLHLPIHIFGCITPGVMLAYFLSGADIFDGLNWIRYNFTLSYPLHPLEFSLAEGTWEMTDTELYISYWRQNLCSIRRLRSAMNLYCDTGDFEHLLKQLMMISKAIELAKVAGANLPVIAT